jgi:hypothetical protein
LALAVPLTWFTPRVGRGLACYVDKATQHANMKRARKLLLIAFGAVVLLVTLGVIFFRLPPDDGRTPAERRQIADACFTMLHSSLTNDVDAIEPDDSRIPEVIRALHPISIIVDVDFSVQIDCNGKPAEYFLM